MQGEDSPLGLRPEVRKFAREMERILRKNDHKGGWDRDTLHWLFAKLIEEVGEVGKCFVEYVWSSRAPVNSKEIDALLDELVDVANIAMMLHDKISTQEKK